MFDERMILHVEQYPNASIFMTRRMDLTEFYSFLSAFIKASSGDLKAGEKTRVTDMLGGIGGN